MDKAERNTDLLEEWVEPEVVEISVRETAAGHVAPFTDGHTGFTYLRSS